MNRPPFYAGTAPDAWLKTPRNSDDPVRQAYAGFHYERERNGLGAAIGWTVVVILVGLLALHFLAR